MGYASAYSPCGCHWTRLMEPIADIYVDWVKCPMHYVPEIDDLKVLEAAANKRRLDEQFWVEATKFFHGGK